MCSKEFCPCDETYKDLYTSIDEKTLRKSQRAKSLDAMTADEKKEYEKLGANAGIIPLYFTAPGDNTYVNANQCFRDQATLLQSTDKIKDSYANFGDDVANGKGGIRLMVGLENHDYFSKKDCASVCDYVPLFYSYRHISYGKPKDTCTNVFLNDWFKEQGLDNGAASFTGCYIMFTLSIIAQLAAILLTLKDIPNTGCSRTAQGNQ